MTTAKIALPELSVSQAGKEITHNQALAILDQLTQAVVIDKDLATPPGSPTNGVMYIVGSSPTGDWSGKEGQLAYWLTSVGAWTFVVPAEGWMVWVTDEALRYERRSGAWSISKARELLFSSRYYYVRTDGNDSNNGLSDTAGGAFLTIQKAVDAVSSLDIGVYGVTISVAPGTYNEGTGVKLKSLVGGGDVTIRGSGALNTDTQVFTSGTVLQTQAVFYSFGITGRWKVDNLRVYSTASGVASGVLAGGCASLTVGNIDYGSGFVIQIRSLDSGAMLIDSSYSISAGASQHYGSGQNGVIRAQGVSVSIAGTPAFSGFCTVVQGGAVVAISLTFVGSATGLRYSAEVNGIINTGGAGVTYLPGDVAGTIATGGQYV